MNKEQQLNQSVNDRITIKLPIGVSRTTEVTNAWVKANEWKKGNGQQIFSSSSTIPRRSEAKSQSLIIANDDKSAPLGLPVVPC